MTCGAKHPRYKNSFCKRLSNRHRGLSHLADGPRGFWVEWDDDLTKKLDFWEMIQRMTDQAKTRQRRDDLRLSSRCSKVGGREDNHVRSHR